MLLLKISGAGILAAIAVYGPFVVSVAWIVGHLMPLPMPIAFCVGIAAWQTVTVARALYRAACRYADTL